MENPLVPLLLLPGQEARQVSFREAGSRTMHTCAVTLYCTRPGLPASTVTSAAAGRQAGPWILMGILCFWFVVCVSVAAVLVHGWVGGPPSARPTSSRRLRHDGRVLWGSAGPGHCMDLNGGSWSVPILHRGFGDCW